MPAFSAIRKRKAAARAEEAAYAAEKIALGPGPAPPPGPLASESFSRAAGVVQRSEYARRRARPVNALTATPALGAQLGIRRPAKGGY